MKKILLSVILGLFFTLAKAQDTNAGVYRFSLGQCLDYALGYNYNRQSLKLTEDTREETYQQSKRERLPSLNASSSESLSESNGNSSWNGNYSLSANVTLYQGGSITNTIKQNKLRSEQSSYQTLQYENNLIIRIVQAFLTVLGNEELLNYQKVVVQASEEQWKQGEKQYQVGKILESDYLLLEAQAANDKNNITDTEINRGNNMLALKNLLSMRPNEELQIIYPDTSAILEMAIFPDKEYVLNHAMQTLPDIRISDYNIKIAEMGVKLSKASYFPTVSLNGSIGTGHSNDYANFGSQLSDRLNEQVGISLSIPIFDNSRTKSKVTQSKIALKQAELDKQQTELDILQEVATNYQNVVSAYNKYQTTTIRQNAYHKTFEVYRAQFNVGAITAVELLQQQNNYISALNDYIQSKYEFMLKRKILDVYMGVQVKM
ncbi:Toxin and drug export protein A [termite gut metagenome]|uniref:Toxin and drug export protein A n=1 Tax=termite gut metagenome TaxID=433724 RepID=A0A5J4R253_9ZZZZ